MSAPPPSSTAHLAARAVLRLGALVALCVWGVRAGWTHLAWLLAGVCAMVLVNLPLTLRYNRGLVRARLEPDRPSEPFDRFFLAASFALFGVLFGLAGWDVLVLRFAVLPAAWAWVGLAVWAVGDVPIAWAMVQNPFLERTVRVQSERALQVITTGPYRWVRHPMYSGMTLLYAGMPLLLGSALGIAPAGLLAGLLACGRVREERVLLRELPGYAAYAERTRWRLLPGLF